MDEPSCCLPSGNPPSSLPGLGDVMLKLSGSRSSFCDGLSRRNFLKAGALGLGGLGLADLLRLQAEAGMSPNIPKSVILICLPGGPSHIDMYDMKPDAPAEYRGEFRPISTNLPGLEICEHMPLYLARPRVRHLASGGCESPESSTQPKTSGDSRPPLAQNVSFLPARSITG